LVAAEGLLLDVEGTSGILTLNAPIADIGGTVVVKKYGSGEVVLSGSSTFTGSTTVYEGTLVAQHANALGTTAGNTVVNTNAVLEIAGGITTAGEPLTLYGTLSSQSGANTFAGAITTVYGGMIDVSSSSLLIVSGSTTGSGGFTKKGGGTLRITADPNQTGLYTVDAGTLELNHSGTTAAPITIAPGATLR
jgi:autotransporter-associated beta strand protein